MFLAIPFILFSRSFTSGLLGHPSLTKRLSYFSQAYLVALLQNQLGEII